MKKIFLSILFVFSIFSGYSQDIPEHISYTRMYDFMDELANDGFIELNSAVKPYSRSFIAEKLLEAQTYKNLNKRQKDEIRFFLNDLSPEQNKLPDTQLGLIKNDNITLAFIQPAFNYKDTLFRARIVPLLGLNVTHNANGNIIKRWFGADLHAMIGKHLSVYGSLRDISVQGALLARPSYLNDYQGYEYKESAVGGDFSDSRGGIKYAWNWGSFGLVKDNVIWGDNYHGSNILSGRAPSFPMLALHLKPCKWFEMQYIHGWLVSNVIDSTRYYTDNVNDRHFRMKNKFIAANLFTFIPIRNLNLSIGNSIVYAEDFIEPAYLLPIAFYKSEDHTLTKGLGLENQNSQIFLNLSSRNIKHLHLFTSIYADEISLNRFSPSVAQKNPISVKVGAGLSNFPFKNVSIEGEYTRNAIIVYKHSIPALNWASNDYNLGSYLGDNSQEIYVALKFKPLRGMDFSLSYVNALHGNEFRYLRREENGVDATKIFLAQPFLGEISWSNKTISFNAQYEIINNGYAVLRVDYSDIRGYDLNGTRIPNDQSEVTKTAQGYLNMFTPAYLQGKNTTISVGFSFGF